MLGRDVSLGKQCPACQLRPITGTTANLHAAGCGLLPLDIESAPQGFSLKACVETTYCLGRCRAWLTAGPEGAAPSPAAYCSNGSKFLGWRLCDPTESVHRISAASDRRYRRFVAGNAALTSPLAGEERVGPCGKPERRVRCVQGRTLRTDWERKENDVSIRTTSHDRHLDLLNTVEAAKPIRGSPRRPSKSAKILYRRQALLEWLCVVGPSEIVRGMPQCCPIDSWSAQYTSGRQ